jgi:tetratricopeptide (TPR) repeat protein
MKASLYLFAIWVVWLLYAPPRGQSVNELWNHSGGRNREQSEGGVNPPLPASEAKFKVSMPSKMSSLQQQFQLAKAKATLAQGADSITKGSRLLAAASAWKAVVQYWPGVGLQQAEAAFRHGEILMQLERYGDAMGALQTCLDVAGETEFAMRARLQIAHVYRRQLRLAKAIHYFRLVDAQPQATLRQRNDALEWQGKCWLELGSWTLAVEAFAKWQQQCEGPLEEVRAADLHAQALLQKGQMLEAELLLSRTRSLLRGASLEPTSEGRQLFNALGRMRAEQMLRSLRQFGDYHGDGQVIRVAHRNSKTSNASFGGQLSGAAGNAN